MDMELVKGTDVRALIEFRGNPVEELAEALIEGGPDVIVNNFNLRLPHETPQETLTVLLSILRAKGAVISRLKGNPDSRNGFYFEIPTSDSAETGTLLLPAKSSSADLAPIKFTDLPAREVQGGLRGYLQRRLTTDPVVKGVMAVSYHYPGREHIQLSIASRSILDTELIAALNGVSRNIKWFSSLFVNHTRKRVAGTLKPQQVERALAGEGKLSLCFRLEGDTYSLIQSFVEGKGASVSGGFFGDLDIYVKDRGHIKVSREDKWKTKTLPDYTVVLHDIDDPAARTLFCEILQLLAKAGATTAIKTAFRDLYKDKIHAIVAAYEETAHDTAAITGRGDLSALDD